MGAETNIRWTDRTLNFWVGCQKVGPGCDHCYAEDWDRRYHDGGHWGPDAPRRLTSPKTRNAVFRWNREAAVTGRRWVFCSSLSDVFDNKADPAWRASLFDAMRECRELRFQILTKRIGNAAAMLPADWPGAFPHCGLMITVVNQEEADRDVPKLARTPAAWRGISYEPAIGPVDFRPWLSGPRKLDWIIVGGESGPKARPFDPDWARSVVEQGREHGVPVFVKQMGAKPVGLKLAHAKGEDPTEWPSGLDVRQMPAAA